MDSFRIEWRKSAKKELRRISPSDVVRIVAAVTALAEEPFPPGCVKLTSSERSYRVRVGDYRILYEVYAGVLLIEIIKVGHRRDVYRD
jgi:mRNA interferase RelE/StbE